MIQRALLLINERARRGEKVRRQVLDSLQSQGMELFEEPIDNPKDLPAIIRCYHQQVDLVIVGGGDGTLSSAVPGLLDTGLALGILPLGTANNLARNLGIPLSVPAACRVLTTGAVHRVDLGKVNGHYFFNVSGIGLSAEINQRVTHTAKRRWGVLAYAATAFHLIQQAKAVNAIVSCNHQTLQVQAIQITVCNGRYYGSGLVVAADAAIDDARLDLYGFRLRYWWEAIWHLPAMLQGRYYPKQDAFSMRSQEICIETSEPTWVDVDGEVVTMTPAQFQVLPKALSVVVPNH